MEQPLLVIPHDIPADTEGDAPEWDALPVAEAARRLGLTKAAIRQRIRRGSLPATKRQGEWYVHVACDITTATPRPTLRDTSPAGAEHVSLHATDSTSVDGHLGQAASLPEVAEHIAAAYRGLVNQQQQEIQFLKVELGRKDELLRGEQDIRRREVQELHVLLQRAQAQIPMPTLAAQPPESSEEQPTVKEPQRRRWWSRLFSSP